MFQFISHHTDDISYLEGIRLALEGGCKWIQLRMKDASDDEVLPIALQAQEMCKKAHATFILDDRVELVKEIHADGVHLGKNDMPISQARAFLGNTYIIGGTANTYEDVENHVRQGANYIGCGPFRFTTTKQRLSPILGLEGYQHIVDKMRAQGIQIPIVAIGGIMKEDIPSILKTGVTGIALSGSILKAENPVEETRQLIETMKRYTLS